MNGLLQKLALPDLWQQEAFRALRNGQDVIVDAPTGAGKTRVFELYVESGALRKRGQAVFTVPTRALANDKWFEWNELGWDVGIVTGDLVVRPDAEVIVATLETQRERLLRNKGPACLVIDEYQMISHPARGVSYEVALAIAPPNVQLLLLSGSVANPEDIAGWLRSKQRQVQVIRVKERPVPLDEVHLASLPYEAPKSIKGHWPRLAIETLLADLAPLLIFVPQRHRAEQLAKKIADALPDVDPLELSNEQEQVCEKPLRRMLKRRVAYHHSGLSYQVRAGLIEPLARHGQLRVIVATMGLAAGINFSVRTVHIAETSFMEGPYLRQLRPDELLQMFGRAGRRGKDDCGYVLYHEDTPRLMDARAQELRRTNEVDWPTLIRLMQREVVQGGAPLLAAAKFCEGLFSKQPVRLGFEREGEANESQPRARPDAFGLGPTERQILNSRGVWERGSRGQSLERPLSEALFFHSETVGWIPAMQSFRLIKKRIRKGKLRKIRSGKQSFIISEMVVARRADSADWELNPKIKSLTGDDQLSPSDIREPYTDITRRLEPHLDGGKIHRVIERNPLLLVEIDFREVLVPGVMDSHGEFLIDPPLKTVIVTQATHLTKSIGSGAFHPSPQSPVHAWRSLGLIDEAGVPTRRGQVFSFFYHGDGLAVAAALEDESYPVGDIVWHLANLRGGFRFASFEGGESDRLAVACREAYGPVNHEGYLRLGLPSQYGEGTAEVLQASLARQRYSTEEELGRGDVERAKHEWMSLLRHLYQAPDLDWARWRSLKAAAKEKIELLKTHVREFTVPASLLDAKQRQAYDKPYLKRRDLR